MVSFTPRPLYPREKSPRYPLNTRLGGSQSRCWRRGEQNIFYPTGTRNSDPYVVQPVASRYTDYTIVINNWHVVYLYKVLCRRKRNTIENTTHGTTIRFLKFSTLYKRSPYSDWLGVRVPVGSRMFCSPRRPDQIWDLPSLLSNGLPLPPSPGLKRPGREADYVPSASAEVKKIWIYTSTPPYAFMA
jgi:hypothetical protein